MSPFVLVGLGALGGIGAIARFVLDGAVAARAGRGFPYGTLAVNLTGSFVLGAFVGAALSGDAYRLAGTGLIGGYTTFSTRAFESQRLGEDGQLQTGVLNFVVSPVLGVGAAWLGRHVGTAA